MRKILKFILIAVLPLNVFAFDIFSPIEIPNSKQYAIYTKEFANKEIPDSEEAAIETSLLIYNIQSQAVSSTNLFYLEDNQIKKFTGDSWVIPIGKMLTVALFEYVLDKNIVTKLAYQDLNIRQNYTLSGTTPYGTVLDLDNHVFYLYITFYLTNEKTNETQIKTFKFDKTGIEKMNVDEYVQLSNDAAANIFSQLRPWLVETIKSEQSKKIPVIIPKLKTTSN